MNMPLQGLQADIIKLAMIKVYEKICYGSSKIDMVMQVHDELVFEADNDIAENYGKKIKKEMEGIFEGKIPFPAEVTVSDKWEK